MFAFQLEYHIDYETPYNPHIFISNSQGHNQEEIRNSTPGNRSKQLMFITMIC